MKNCCAEHKMLMDAKDLELEEFENILKMKKEENNSLRAEVKQLKLWYNREFSTQGWASPSSSGSLNQERKFKAFFTISQS